MTPLEQLRCGQLAGNRLRALPPELAACTRLELLRVAANRLSEFPAFLLALPRLAWLAYAGNPFCEDRETAALAEAPIASIAWDRLQLQQQLGAGASGVIHQAQWTNGEDIQPVAVKLFKGAVTSDGLPQCEMTASIRAGAHAHLIPVLGQVLDHPQGMHAMVLSLIDPAWRNLAGPPSLDSCTRDIYAADTTFDLTAALGIALSVASAARHLHAQGLMHGDLYAHNILHSRQGAALLADFGAASFFAPDDQQRAHALQRLEVRAFACLLEELLARCAPQADTAHAMKSIAALKTACLQENPDQRPLFAEIEQMLRTLTQPDPRPEA